MVLQTLVELTPIPTRNVSTFVSLTVYAIIWIIGSQQLINADCFRRVCCKIILSMVVQILNGEWLQVKIWLRRLLISQ